MDRNILAVIEAIEAHEKAISSYMEMILKFKEHKEIANHFLNQCYALIDFGLHAELLIVEQHKLYNNKLDFLRNEIAK